MDKILRTHEISTEIINLIEESKEYCYLVTPYFKPWPLFNRAIEKAAKQEKNIVFVFRYDQQDLSLMKRLNTDFDFDVIFIDNLHSKLYINESKVILTSMNLYERSKELNFETGYLLDRKSTAKKFLEDVIRGDLLSIKPALFLSGRYGKKLREEKEEAKKKEIEKIENLKKVQGANQFRSNNQGGSFVPKNQTGYCIRCRVQIPQSNYITMCNNCYQTWASWGDGEFPERYCHLCGKEAHVNKDKPLCYDCYSVNQGFNNSF